MRIRLQTSVGGLLVRAFLLLIVGGGVALWADHHGYLPSTPTQSVPQVAPTPSVPDVAPPASPVARPRPTVAAVSSSTGCPAVDMDLLGICIPPPGK